VGELKRTLAIHGCPVAIWLVLIMLQAERYALIITPKPLIITAYWFTISLFALGLFAIRVQLPEMFVKVLEFCSVLFGVIGLVIAGYLAYY
jgi:hypothetical protein